jgi:two-component system phosphate regulon sensor histidine kinase PhoR
MQSAEPDKISALLSKTVDNLRILASKKGIAIDFAINLNKPVQVAIDGLERVLINLITNAIESTPAHGSIAVNFSQNGEGAELSVEDTGTGFDSDFISYAFDRFSRSDAEQIEEKNGFGLGLSLVKVIVDSCEGTVEVANKRVGQGAVVTTWFKNSSGSQYHTK